MPYPPKKPEDPGCRRDDHPSESRHQARDLVGSDHQFLDRKTPSCKTAEAEAEAEAGFDLILDVSEGLTFGSRSGLEGSELELRNASGCLNLGVG